MDASRHQSFPLNPTTVDDCWREEVTLGRAIRAYRYDERHVVRKRSSHEVMADRLFVDSEGGMKVWLLGYMSAMAIFHQLTIP